ncbi:MAG: glycosyltransferase family 4 protein [Tepidisphaeraceae bacterium]|jgi:glycosyltransferase involved in cell wall biosynthesis
MNNGRPLRILHLIGESDAGGLSRYLYDLCAAMHAQGHQVTVAGQRGLQHHLFQNAPWEWIDVPLKGGPFDLMRAAMILRRHLRKNPVDLLHTHYRRPTIVARYLQNVCGGRLPLLFTLHLSHMRMRGGFLGFSDFGDAIHCAASDARQWLIDDVNIPPDRIFVIPHGIDINRYPLGSEELRRKARAELSLGMRDRVALFVGRLSIPKNEHWLFDLADVTRKSMPDLRILLAGTGPHENLLRRRLEDDNLEDRVFLLGERNPVPLYHAADALLLPSYKEGFALVCAEAMATGLPVLRTRTSGTSETIIEGVTGRSVPIDRPTFVKAAIEFLADLPALRRMGQAAAQHVRQNLTFDRQVRDMISLYRRLIEGAAAPAKAGETSGISGELANT